ncbi:Phosphotransferase enzyme family protein [Paenibacillus sp. UNC496MF]|uniref:phosphotransferase family protein n=1 Tax=Paenibacillus sp. UNC496MF TaxID=1502753 RepID=UPI0008E58A08|nr:aminoglycoside phosphotransferase family protein [Paenibacillus sp. UNC496MF]SFJ12316.1 Phosphotransferase enzyme family protein [Paenibacillus sp. UNC496MF]
MFNNAEWLREEPDAARHEAWSLETASALTGARAPKLVALDEAGDGSGMPAVLMTRLEGEVVLAPREMGRWLEGIARALAALHAADAGGGARWTHARYADAAKMDASAWSRVPDAWTQAARIALAPPPAYEPRFIHRDFHAANVLWSGGEVSGIVDWPNGCIGAPGLDVGHCRADLAQLHGPAAADAFLDAYRRHAGEAFAYDPYWDFVSLIDIAYWEPGVFGGWTELGAQGLTKALIVERLDDYVRSLLLRAESRRA